MDWILVVLYLTDDRKLHQAVAENIVFRSGKECREHHETYRSIIDKKINGTITNYLPKGMGYNIEWQGCMVWNKEKIDVNN